MTLIKKADIDKELPVRRRGIVLPFRSVNLRSSNGASTGAIGVTVGTAIPVDGSNVKKSHE